GEVRAAARVAGWQDRSPLRRAVMEAEEGTQPAVPGRATRRRPRSRARGESATTGPCQDSRQTDSSEQALAVLPHPRELKVCYALWDRIRAPLYRAAHRQVGGHRGDAVSRRRPKTAAARDRFGLW